MLEKCLQEYDIYTKKGIALFATINDFDSNVAPCKEEFSVQSLYLPRGYYCPSPDIEHIVTNMCRGKIAKHLTKNSKPTNRYLFDTENKLRIAETFYPNCSPKVEYLFYEENTILGFTYNRLGGLQEISVEQHSNGRISSYLWATGMPFYQNQNNISRLIYELYSYRNNASLETNFYNMDMALSRDRSSYSYIVTHYTYHFDLDKNGRVVPGSGIQLAKSRAVLKPEDGALS